MRRPSSLRFRMMALFTALVGVLLTAAYSASYLAFTRTVHAQLDQRLLSVAGPLLADFKPEPADDGPRRGRATTDDDVKELSLAGEFIEILDSQGHLLERSANLLEHPLQLGDMHSGKAGSSFRSVTDSRFGKLRAVFIPFLRDTETQVLVVAISERDTQAAISRFRSMILILLPSSLFLAAAISVWYVGRSLRPVAELTLHAEEMTARLGRAPEGEIWEPLPVPAAGGELGRLAETFNQLFGRVDGMVRQLRQFVSDASHELRTPLTVLQGETDLLLSRPRSEEQYRAALTIMDGELHTLSRIVEGLFTICLSDAGQLRPGNQSVDLSEILEESCALVGPLAKTKGITVVRGTHGETPFPGDETILRQLFVIFLDNAIKYSAPGTTVRATLETDNGWAQVRFADTGMGISPEHLPHIFERFYRASPAGSPVCQSGGLGLPIAQAIARAYGGSIDCDSTSEVGSTFTVRLPIRR